MSVTKKKEAETDESLKARIAELETKVQDQEEGALNRVCQAMGINPADIQAKEEAIKNDPMVFRDIPGNEIKINGRIYRGRVEVPLSVARDLDNMLSQRRMRVLRESFGSEYQLREVLGIGAVPQVTSKINIYGEKV